MLFPLKKLLVNWVDGMKISKEHLVYTEDFFIDAVRDSVNIRLNSFNYGLLPPYTGQTSSSDFEIKERITGHVDIELRRCNAITSGGCRIDINPSDSAGYLKLDHVFETGGIAQEKMWDVILIVQPFIRVSVGVPDDDETPPRHPFADKLYKLSITPKGQINSEELGMHNLIIGRIKKNGDRYVVDHTYIPPCTSMLSHIDLKNYYNDFTKYLSEIEISSYSIIRKILERDKSLDVAIRTQFLCEHILNYLSTIFFKYNNMGRNLSPIEIMEMISAFAHRCFVALNFIPKTKRDEMLQYYYTWSDVTPGDFIDMLTKMIEAKYDHNDIRLVMVQMNAFLSQFAKLWTKLSELEYIGFRKDNVVVAIQEKQDIPIRKSGWTILD